MQSPSQPLSLPKDGFQSPFPSSITWKGDAESIVYDEARIRDCLETLDQPVWIIRAGNCVGVSVQGEMDNSGEPDGGMQPLAWLPAFAPQQLGDAGFRKAYGTKYALYAGAMANAIASEEMVIALSNAGMLGSFGAAGLPPQRLEAAIQRIQESLPGKPYAFNLIHSPYEPVLEQRAVELYLHHGVALIEASAYLDLTLPLVQYRAAGLVEAPTGDITPNNRVIAKISRGEVARRFMEPAPADLLNQLTASGRITREQAERAARVPVADDITVEADSGGHTDNRPLVCLLPSILALRDEIQTLFPSQQKIRVGAAGGISTPASALAAFMMGADYVVTGSVNQACIESGASAHTRGLLAQAGFADMTMAPSSDMFEMGVRVQVLKRGTLFPMRAQKLYELYTRYDSIEALPADEYNRLEKQVFKRNLDEIWEDTVKFFTERDPSQIVRAMENPKEKMALIFRWYLGLSSRWSSSGEKGREMDYQIWCGPSMGAFNEWVRGTELAEPANRRVVEVNLQILTGCAYLARVRLLAQTGIGLSAGLATFRPANRLYGN